MMFSRLVRWILVGCAAMWLAAPSSPAQIVRSRAQHAENDVRQQPAARHVSQDSPLATPVSPLATPANPFMIPTPVGPIATPVVDPYIPPRSTECLEAEPCNGDDEASAEPGFAAFVPDAEQGQASSRSPQPAPDLGTILNYVAIAIIAIGLPLRIYWVITDRRKKKEQ